jgi:hypothetical protein
VHFHLFDLTLVILSWTLQQTGTSRMLSALPAVMFLTLQTVTTHSDSTLSTWRVVERKVLIYRPLMIPAWRSVIAAKCFNILTILVSHEVQYK